MSKCKAAQNASVIQALGLEGFDTQGRLFRTQLISAASDLEERRNRLGNRLLALKDATLFIEATARDMGRADDLEVLELDALRRGAAQIVGDIIEFMPVRGYSPEVKFEMIAEDYVKNQIYFFATHQSFEQIQAAINEQLKS